MRYFLAFMAITACVVVSMAAGPQEGMVPFELPAKANPQSLIQMLPPSPIGADGPRVTAVGERFEAGERVFRVWGMNMGGGVNPSHEDAVAIAERLAQAGVNCVRFQGMDTAGFWQTVEVEGEAAAQRDRFDFFVAELARRGIYSNFNLQVSRHYSRELHLADWDQPLDKIVDILTPQIVEAQKAFARLLLGHVNPYRKLRYADDPAVAFVEINNEGSLFLWDAAQLLPRLPEFYAKILQEQFNAFLRETYGTDDKLRAAWGGLGEGESLQAGSVKVFADGEGERRVIDRLLCLMKIEEAYWTQMYDCVKKDLGYKGQVTGTIVFGPCNLYAQRNMDWIDCHAYWGHPRWAKDIPRWDSVRWTLPRAAMTDSPDKTVTDLDELSGLMFYMAAQQFRGKPYTNSEYNHCAPNDYQAECVPMISSFGAVQGWDGLWFFMYSDSTSQGQVDWFDFRMNPAKWGFMPAGAALFRDGGLLPLSRTRHVSFAGRETPKEDLVRGQLRRNYDMFAILRDAPGLKWGEFLNTRLVVNLDGEDRVEGEASDGLVWDVAPNGHGRYVASGPGGRVWIGHADRLQGENGLTLAKPHFVVVTLTAMDGQPLETSRKALITAVFRCENTGMVFNEARDSVGNQWGSRPVLIEPVEATIAGIEAMKGKWTCRALKPDGTAGENVPVSYDSSGIPRIELSPQYGTMWYLLERP